MTLKQILTKDLHYLKTDFWAHDYGLHFFAAVIIQMLLFIINHVMHWFDLFHAGLLFTLIHGMLWLLKEICSTVQAKITFGILPNTQPDWRDWRMSMYGILAFDLTVFLINLFAY